MTDRLLGCFRLGRELGAGGMGKVHAATVVDRCPGLDEGARVALKIVHPHLLEQPGFFRRFLREAEIGAAVRHPNVVRTYLADALGGEHFLVMEYVEGQTLRELLDELDRVPEELCRHIAREVCKGLAAIHEAGVVHRDLKPDNVLITPEHEVKVMDLGVARLTAESIRLSRSGAFVGSVEYAAPEQFAGGHGAVDHRCDLHGLGLLLYELSTGQHPFRADDFRVVMHNVLHEEPRHLGDANPQLSPFFEEVVGTLLAKERGDRFSRADELLVVLEEGEESTWWRERAKALRASTNRPLRRIRIPRETAVYGRENELARLRGLFEQTKSGDGQVVLIDGEAGIGKTRLVDELVARLQADGEDLNFIFASYPPGGGATAAGGFSSAYREHFGEAGSAEFLTQAPLLVPSFDAVLRGEPAPKSAVALTKDTLGTCFVHATRNIASERPTVVLIDDLHFAPDEARALFMALALALAGHRVLLIGTARPGVPEEWVANLTRLDQTTHIELARLGPKDLGLLLHDSFRSEQLALALAGQIAMRSDGNPFFAFAIIRGLREGHFIAQRDDGTWVSTRVVDEIEIPSSVLDLVNARVAGLSEDERNLLDLAACWGFEFDPLLVGEVLGLEPIPLLRRLSLLERRHRLVRSVGQSFVFDHYQVQEALYGGLPELLRQAYHAALARALEARTRARENDPSKLDGALCVELCQHFLKGAQGERALRYLSAAHAQLSKGYVHAEVVALSDRALAVPGLLTGTDRVEVLLRLCARNGPFDLMARRERQEECAREAVRLAADAGDDELSRRALNALGWCLYRTSRHEEAEVAYRRALDIALARGDRRAEGASLRYLGLVCYRRGLTSDAREHLESALVASRESGDQEREAYNSGTLGLVLLSQGLLSEARELHERDLALNRTMGNRPGEARATGNLGNVYWFEGRLRETRAFHERHLALCREIGDRRGEAQATGNLATVAYCLGRMPEARRLFDHNLALCREIRFPEGVAIAQHNLGCLLREVGDAAAAEACLRSSLTTCREIGHRRLDATTQLVLGSLLASERRREEATSALLAARELADDGGFQDVVVLSRCELALLAGDDGQDAIAAYAAHSERLGALERREALLLLWLSTGDCAHLAAAKRLLDEALADVPDDYHDSVCQHVRVNREILAAWRAEHGQDAYGEDRPRDSESTTGPSE